MPTLLPRPRRTPRALVSGLLAALLGASVYGLHVQSAASAQRSAPTLGSCPRAGTAPMPIACVPEP